MGGEPAESEDDLYASLGELAAAEWGIHPREFWDTRPNTSGTPEHELGITNSLLSDLVSGYMKRRRREVNQLVVVVRAALAEKPKDAEAAIEKVAPLPKERVEIDEFGDRVSNGYVVDFWQRSGIYEETA